MTSSDKLSLSSFIVKRAYAGFSGYVNPSAGVNPLPPAPKAVSVTQPSVAAPKAVPVTMAKSAPKAIPAQKPAIISGNKPVKKPSLPVKDFSYYQPILDVIRKGEANTAGYNQMVSDYTSKGHGLTKKTLQQVLDYQDKWLKAKGGTAAGGYQFLRKNLAGLAKQHKHDLNKTLFDQNTQDLYGRSLMDRRGFKDYLSGKINADQMRLNLSKEWAALPAKGEKSYYDKDGKNKARVSSKEINTAIAKALELYRKSRGQ
jgi:muramidase (phage lysozyme)